MPTSKEALLYLLDYSVWANRQLLTACAALSAEELSRDFGSSHTGISGTLRHIYDAERFWLGNLRANTLPPLSEFKGPRGLPPTPSEPDLSRLEQRWPEVWQGLRGFVETATEAELAHEICGIDWTIPRWKLLLHVVNHATLHRGQVMGMMRQLGKQPPSNDIFTGYHLTHP